MIPRTVALPPGCCLTDVWRHLPPAARRHMLRVVQDEAEAVSRETAAYRAGRHVARQMTPREAGEAWDQERRAATERRQRLERAMRGYRVGDAMDAARRGLPTPDDGPP